MSLSDLATGSAQSTFLPNAMNYKGTWSALTPYYKNNVVMGSNNEAYICSVASSLNQDPTTTPASWTAMSVPIVPFTPTLTPIPGASYAWNGGNARYFAQAIPGLVQNGIYYLQYTFIWNNATTNFATIAAAGSSQQLVYNSCVVFGVDLAQAYVYPKPISAPLNGVDPPGQVVEDFYETGGFFFQYNPAGGDQGIIEATAANCDNFELSGCSIIRVA